MWPKGVAKRALLWLGYELRSVERAPAPALHADPWAAVHVARANAPVRFGSSLDHVRDTQGFGFHAEGWHPLVAALRHSDRSGLAGKHRLQRFLDGFQPRTALEALPGFDALDPCGLQDLPPHHFGLTPWFAGTPQTMDANIRRWCQEDAREHGLADFDLNRHGVAYFGPTSAEVIALEWGRLEALRSSLSERGYDRGQGDCRFYLVRRGSDFRAIAQGGGRHRTAALAALGHDCAPGRFVPPVAVDVRDVADWPQVRSGMWSQRDARRYVDHLFDFDSRRWARERGLL